MVNNDRSEVNLQQWIDLVVPKLETEQETEQEFEYDETPKPTLNSYTNSVQYTAVSLSSDVRARLLSEVKTSSADVKWYNHDWMGTLIVNAIELRDATPAVPGYGNIDHQLDIVDLTIKTIQKMSSLNDIVGIQPMCYPVGIVFSLHHKSTQDVLGLEKITLELLKNSVEAKVRNLKVRNLKNSTTLESFEDFKKFNDVLISDMALTISTDIVDELIKEIRDVATVRNISNVNNQHLVIELNKIMNAIACSTKRGVGNWLIIDKDMLTRFVEINEEIAKQRSELGLTTVLPFNLTTVLPNFNNGPLQEVGNMFDGSVKIFCFSHQPKNEILVGYTGKASTFDTGMIYTPYQLVLCTGGFKVDSTTFVPKHELKTRYNIFKQDKAKDYYVKLVLD